MKVTLRGMNAEETGRICGCSGGRRFRKKLNSMGLHTGRSITKVSNSFIGGPVMVRVNGSLVAVGQRMADRIQVEVTRK
jgi:ferrous iron transport protein A